VITQEVEVAADSGCLLGECPVWLPGAAELLFVDILAGRVHRLSPSDGSLATIELGVLVGAVAPRAAGDLVVATPSGFELVEWERGRVEMLAAVEPDQPDNRMNDGKCDSSGRFWAGTMSQHRTPGAGSLYRLDADRSVTRVVSGSTISNGLAWSPDDSTMYYIDSEADGVDAFDFDAASGEVANRRRLVELDRDLGEGDGMTVDSAGNLWIACLGGSSVRCFSPQGALEEVIELPVQFPTSCAFGGTDLRDLYITTSQHRLERPGPLDGAVFHCRPGVAGIAAPPYRG
jgi:sugar lactone lactonase YvrE